MSQLKKVQSALISVFHKEGLEPIIEQLKAHGVTIYSTGGTQTYIEGLGAEVHAVENLTSYPSILGGRVKTLHPKVFGGILGRRELQEDVAQLEQYEIPEIDLVIVDLYPFEETVASGAEEQAIIEKIDIGGISLIRAAAKNYKDVVIVPSKDQYGALADVLNDKQGHTDISDRKWFAKWAFEVSSHYDTAIFNYFDDDEVPLLKLSESESKTLRYGENPHQNAAFFGPLSDMFDQLHGKELSYNNLLDVDAAVNLIAEFDTANGATFAILKHNNACGVATRPTVEQAYSDALAGDPVSAFGGILITNVKINAAAATLINDLFCEVVIAPSYDDDALVKLKEKKNRIILVQKPCGMDTKTVRTALNGYLVQDKDLQSETESDFTVVTNEVPTEEAKKDLVFASRLVKQTKSNAIVLAKNGQLLASGTGQTSRVDALRQAIKKAKSFGFELEGAVMASDAFFPFPDCVEIAHGEGIKFVVQPGGSIKDQESIDYCNANGMAMVTTGVRHFKH